MDIGFAIGSIMRLQVPRVRMANGWALGKFAGGFAQARRLTLGSSNLVYFCEPTLRTQLHISVCGLNVGCCETAIGPELGAKRKCRARAQNVADDPTLPFAARLRCTAARKVCVPLAHFPSLLNFAPSSTYCQSQ